MKIRTDFVTNSSSSSFVIFRKDITPIQLEMLLNYIHIIKTFGDKIPNLEYPDTHDSWEIDVNDEKVTGFTCMDNWGFDSFLEYIGLDMEKVKYENDG